MQNDVNKTHLVEAVAFMISAIGCSGDFDACRDTWQKSEDRADYRKEAERFLGELESRFGVSLRAKPKKVEEGLEWLLTIPPRAAYSLPETGS